jgi:hypothetical protein
MRDEAAGRGIGARKQVVKDRDVRCAFARFALRPATEGKSNVVLYRTRLSFNERGLRSSGSKQSGVPPQEYHWCRSANWEEGILHSHRLKNDSFSLK